MTRPTARPRSAELDASTEARAQDVVNRILARAGTAIQHEQDEHTGHDGDQLDLAERTALQRVGGLSTELQDVSEVEYRQLRLERVVLVGQIGRAACRERGEITGVAASWKRK